MRWFRKRPPATTLEQGENPPGSGGEAAAAVEGRVPGERDVSAVSRPASLQSRVSNVLAFGLMGSLAIGFLIWYYANTAANRAGVRNAAQTSSKGQVEGDMTLPPLGRVDPPSPPIESLLGPAPEEPPPPGTPEAWLQPAEEPVPQRATARTVPDAHPAKTPEEIALQRQLSGRAFSTIESQGGAPDGSARVTNTATPLGSRAEGRDLDSWLTPSAIATVKAHVLPTQRLLMPKGTFLDCTLETAIASTLPGMTTCLLATDAFSADRSVVLLDRGSKLTGETRGQVRQGTARIFVLWTEARTPSGVVVPLASPGTDELGRSGLPGEVDRHFWDRFGAALLVSVIDGGIQAAVQSQRDSGGTLVVSPSQSRDVMTEVLKSTLDIPPTVTKANGDRIQVLVARDLDFRSVYELRPVLPKR